MLELRKEGPSYEHLVRLVEVFSGDEDLMSWFLSLERMAETTRTSHLRNMVEGLKNANERTDLIEAVEVLQSPTIFSAAVRTIRDLGK